MPTPTITIRLDSAHHGLLREIAAALKADAAVANRLRAVLGCAQAVSQPAAPTFSPDILARLEALERTVDEMRPKVGRPKHSPEARVRAAAFRAEVAAFAKAQGTTAAELARRLAAVTGNTAKAEEKALRGDRPVSKEAAERIRAALGMRR